jgi:hypothetical protein
MSHDFAAPSVWRGRSAQQALPPNWAQAANMAVSFCRSRGRNRWPGKAYWQNDADCLQGKRTIRNWALGA